MNMHVKYIKSIYNKIETFFLSMFSIVLLLIKLETICLFQFPIRSSVASLPNTLILSSAPKIHYQYKYPYFILKLVCLFLFNAMYKFRCFAFRCLLMKIIHFYIYKNECMFNVIQCSTAHISFLGRLFQQ